MTARVFPLGKLMGMRQDNYAQSEINRIDNKIAANERTIGELAHANWLLRLERTQFEEDLRG